MTVTIVGVLADELGAASQLTVIPYGGPSAGRNFDVKKEFFSVSSLHYRSVQSASIDVDHNHDKVIGHVAYLERSPNGQLHAVCEIDGNNLDGPLYFSPHVSHYNGKDIELRGLAVCRNPATVGLPAIAAYPGKLDEAAWKVVYQHGYNGELVRRAHEYDRRRKSHEPLVIQGKQPAAPAPTLTPATRGRVEHRSATALDIRAARRELDLLIAPAERPTKIYERTRSYTEVFSHGAFAGAEQNPEKVKANLHHIRERIVGRAVRLDPWAESGLEGTIKLAKVRDADEALALIDDGLLGVSAGFAVHPSAGSEQWSGRSLKRVRRAVLDHVALVVQPAYETAQVLDVRRQALAG